MNINEEIPFDMSEFGMEVPPVPEEYQELVAEWGGNTGGVPNVRIVTGTDPTVVDWCAGEWIPRYSVPEVDTVEYAIWHKPDGTKKIMTPAEAKVMDSSKKIDGIILPVVETKVKDWLIPRYFVEVYRPADYYGNQVEWDKQRMSEGVNGEVIDLMGDFPENGQYETWFCIEDVETDEAGNVTMTKFRGLDDEVMEYLREQIHTAKNVSAYEQAVQATEDWNEKENTKKEQFRDTVKEILMERIDRITDTPSNIRIK